MSGKKGRGGLPKEDREARLNIALQAVRYAGDDVGSRTIAKMLHEDHPDVYPSVESARNSVRWVRGGKTCKNKPNGIDTIKKPEFAGVQRPPAQPGDFMPAPLGKGVVPKPFRITEGKWAIFGDLHAPFHDEKALEKAVKYAQGVGANNLYLNGDSCDLHHFSSWFKDPLHGDGPEHWRTTVQVLEWLTYNFERVVFKWGNHEDRYHRFIGTKNADMIGIPTLDLESVMQLRDMGITEVVKTNQTAYFGKCPVLHGHELTRGFASPVNPAKGAFNKAGDMVVVNHWHRSSSHVEKQGITDNLVITRSIGCLCRLKASYSPVTKWNHGFAIVEIVDEEGNFNFDNLIIHKDQIFGL